MWYQKKRISLTLASLISTLKKNNAIIGTRTRYLSICKLTKYKSFKKNTQTGTRRLSRSEALHQITLRQENILPVFGYYWQQINGRNYLVIVSKLCRLDLASFLAKYEFNFPLIQKFMLQACNGLKTIARANLTHG